jgi:hypothetical protein
MAALRDRSAASWMKLFDERYKGTQWPYGSGVWGKREWVMPLVPDELIVSMDEGGTNLFWDGTVAIDDERAVVVKPLSDVHAVGVERGAVQDLQGSHRAAGRGAIRGAADVDG